ncbi:MAG: hypothetical protein EOO51_14800 [Flavobacterium sp.]|nr:MAG: hypothetical protein EOO51_14800 [Flavobacterium sp.]
MIVSKFRTAVTVKYVSGILLAIVIIGISMVNSVEEGTVNYRGTAFFIATVTCAFLLFGFFDLFLLARIRLVPDGIENETVILKKITHLPYSEIRTIELRNERSTSKGGYINDGYPVSSITFHSGMKLVISSGCYENYTEIMNHIRQECERLRAQKSSQSPS